MLVYQKTMFDRYYCIKLDVRSTLHGQVSLAAVNQICVIHEAMNGCKNLKIH